MKQEIIIIDSNDKIGMDKMNELAKEGRIIQFQFVQADRHIPGSYILLIKSDERNNTIQI